MKQTGAVLQSSLRITAVFALMLLGAGCASQPKPLGGVDYYIMGVQAQRAGKGEQAVELFEKAIALNPNLRMAHIQLGDAYRNKGNYARAATHYEAATRLDPYALYNHYNLGVAYQLLNRFQEAARAYLKALELNPRDVRSNMNLGLVYLALGEGESAVAFLERATRLDPSFGQAWSNLGVALDAQGDLMKAESTYRKALELDSTNLATLQNLAQNLISQKKAPEAIAIMEQVLRRDDSPAAHRRYAEALAMANRFDAAISELDRVIKSDPTYLPAVNQKADVLIRRYVEGLELDNKLRLAALDLWRSSLKLNANQPKVRDLVRRWESPAVFGK